MHIRLQEQTKIEVETLLEKTGRTLTLDDFADVLEIDKLVRTITKVPKTLEQDLLGIPMLVAGCKFYPVTIGHLLFADAELDYLQEQDPQLYVYSLCYLLTVRAVADLPEYEGFEPQAFEKRVTKWQHKSPLREEHFAHILEKLYSFDVYAPGPDEDVEVERKATDYGPLIALLVREYGKDPQYWLTQPQDIIQQCLDDYEREQIRELNIEAAKFGGKQHSGALDEIKKANMRLSKKLDEVLDRWQRKTE